MLALPALGDDMFGMNYLLSAIWRLVSWHMTCNVVEWLIA
jgi:hypothetical protein